ncbi:unnamed protein product [Hermetia illucens]|uniref:Medium-chain acyl-CoA ligase ACSF2, mitochondrial n=1 Tax=Hermetia illucens TaxID=343691 RepID=A0A7R8YPP2_HERIL|nr:medium-chain acyl-CoA ligase ACSF2, mitochondrial-like [Hermetia illucens]CAD7079650.1 unnamed protein product [Hermetia illucens]
MALIRFNRPSVFRSLSPCLYSSSSSDSSSSLRGPSYYHNVGKEPLVYRSIGQQLELTAQSYPDREGIVSIYENNRLTFGSILEQCNRLAASFKRLGLERGDRVGIWAPNYAFWYITMLASSRAGLISVGINPAFQTSEIEYCINKVNLNAIVAPDVFKTTHYYDILKTVCPEIGDCEPGKLASRTAPSLKSVIIHSKDKFPGAFQYEDIFNYATEDAITQIQNSQRDIQPDWPCNIQFTSGTTGQPKATVISHFSLLNNGIHAAQRNELNTKHHKICVQVPFFHTYGVTVGIVAGMIYGSTLVLPSAYFSPKASIAAINEERCTVTYGTPTMYVDLIKKVIDSNAILTTPEIAVTGGASCSPKLLENIKHYLKMKKVKNAFGQTEATSVLSQSLPDETEDHVLHTVGHVTDHVEVKVIDKDGNVVPFGEPGELCCRGYLNCLGYYGDEEKTKELISPDGWLRTGDQFILQEDGYGRIVGRLKEMVIRGGENIFPKEIEDFLNTHPDIVESHVIGVPDERMGEELCAFISLKDGKPHLTHDDLKEFGAGKIAHFKIPRHIRVVHDFPKTVSGKIQKFKLVQQYKDSQDEK